MSLPQMSQNAWRTAWKSAPLLLLKAPGTFSHTANLGYLFADTPRISRIIRIASKNKLLLSPSWIPVCFPATDRSWQGEPNVMMSTGSIWSPCTSVTLPRCFIPGKRCFVTLIGNGSISLAHTGSIPNNAPARGKPPLPSNKLPSFTLFPLFVIWSVTFLAQ